MKLIKWNNTDSVALFGTPEEPIQSDIIQIGHTIDCTSYVGLIENNKTIPSVCTVLTSIPEGVYYNTYDGSFGFYLNNELVDKILKDLRSKEVKQIVVNVNGILLDGDEVSQSRMTRAIVALPNDNSTIYWKTHDNQFVQLTKLQLAQALALAGQKQTELWAKYILD